MEPIATVINNNQDGCKNIIETAPNVTLDIGTPLFLAASSDRKISDRAHSYVCECEEIANDAIHSVCRPLLMAGDGAFYAKNGNYVGYEVVLKEHRCMQSALEKIKGKLDFAKTEIVAE